MMSTHYTYALVDLFCILFPFIASFHPKIKFYKEWRFFVLPCLVTALFFLLWDALFTQMGVWHFNPDYVSGIYVYNLPIEEVAFFICIPYACTFTYYCCRLFFNTEKYNKRARAFSTALIIALLSFAVAYYDHLYTSVTFVLLAAWLFLLLRLKVNFISTFYISFLIILFPFFISNGILTGSFIHAPVVLYNDHQNVGVRMFTIPVEDTFYGMLLLLMNVSGYEWMKRRREKPAYKAPYLFV